MSTVFTFQGDNAALQEKHGHGNKHHRRGNSNSSLSYSVGSSVHSNSTTGESTDSSFAEINKILEDENVKKLLADQRAITPQTITGSQPSNSQENDGGSHGMTTFEKVNPAGSTSVSRRNEKLRNEKSYIATNSMGTCTTSSTNNNKKSTTPPPRMPIQKNDGKELWYSQIWMCGFADSFNFSKE